jgi:hypothetical protein
MGRIEWFRRHRYAKPGPYFCEDQELLLRSYPESRFSTIPEILFAYRVRNRIDWGKSFRTRKTILSVQLRQFYGRRQWHYCVLAWLTFLGRLSLDALNVLIQRGGRPGIQRYHSVTLESNERNRWYAVKVMLGSA